MKRGRGKQSGTDRWNRLPASLSMSMVSSQKKAHPCLSPFFVGSLADLLATSNPKFSQRTVCNFPAGPLKIIWKEAEPSQTFNNSIWLQIRPGDGLDRNLWRGGTSGAAGGGRRTAEFAPDLQKPVVFVGQFCLSVSYSPGQRRASPHLIYPPECSWMVRVHTL